MGYKLTGYYKYSFFFKNSTGEVIYLGGSAEDIYRIEIDPSREYTLRELTDMGAEIRTGVTHD